MFVFHNPGPTYHTAVSAPLAYLTFDAFWNVARKTELVGHIMKFCYGPLCAFYATKGNWSNPALHQLPAEFFAKHSQFAMKSNGHFKLPCFCITDT